MRLTIEEFNSINWNDFSTEEIYCLIDLGIVNYYDIAHYYGNSQWDDVV